jgi:hypothetical protein
MRYNLLLIGILFFAVRADLLPIIVHGGFFMIATLSFIVEGLVGLVHHLDFT